MASDIQYWPTAKNKTLK